MHDLSSVIRENKFTIGNGGRLADESEVAGDFCDVLSEMFSPGF